MREKVQNKIKNDLEVSLMKKWLFAGFGLFLGIALTASLSVAGGLKEIDGRELEALMSDGKRLVIVDVREPEEFAGAHIKSAINIPYGTARPRIFNELFSDDRIVFVCHGGPMGHELGSLLVKNAYQDVYNLKGGMKKWQGEVEKKTP
jgi:rhodanese-related sulfurtransferase